MVNFFLKIFHELYSAKNLQQWSMLSLLLSQAMNNKIIEKGKSFAV